MQTALLFSPEWSLCNSNTIKITSIWTRRIAKLMLWSLLIYLLLYTYTYELLCWWPVKVSEILLLQCSKTSSGTTYDADTRRVCSRSSASLSLDSCAWVSSSWVCKSLLLALSRLSWLDSSAVRLFSISRLERRSSATTFSCCILYSNNSTVIQNIIQISLWLYSVIFQCKRTKRSDVCCMYYANKTDPISRLHN